MKQKTCRICKIKFDSFSSTQIVCGMSCAIERAEKQSAVKQKKANAKQKRGYWDNNIKTRKRAAKEACHAYIRARDKGGDCICCGKPLGSDFQAGHFIPSGNNPKVRFDEYNIHGQRLDCNYFHGGDSDDYKGRLIKKIGADQVDYLLANKGGTMKRTAQDYKKIEVYYKQKLKELGC